MNDYYCEDEILYTLCIVEARKNKEKKLEERFREIATFTRPQEAAKASQMLQSLFSDAERLQRALAFATNVDEATLVMLTEIGKAGVIG